MSLYRDVRYSRVRATALLYMILRYPRDRVAPIVPGIALASSSGKRFLLWRIGLMSGSRRIHGAGDCVIVEFAGSLSFNAKRVNLWAETSP